MSPDSSASTFRIALSLGFPYYCFTCGRDGREPHGSRLAFTGPARPFASQGFTPGQGNLLPSIGPVGSFGPEPTSRRWTGLHRLMTTNKDTLDNYFTNRRVKMISTKQSNGD